MTGRNVVPPPKTPDGSEFKPFADYLARRLPSEQYWRDVMEIRVQELEARVARLEAAITPAAPSPAPAPATPPTPASGA